MKPHAISCLIAGSFLIAASPAWAQGVGVGTGSGSGTAPIPIVTGPPGPAPLIEGTGAISGVVTDAATGQPVAGAVVSLSVASRATIGRASREITDSRGRFVFTKLPAREDYQLLASMAGYFDTTFGQDSLRAANTKIPLNDGQWFSAAKLVLWKGGLISGTVTDEHNDPVVGVFVHVFALASVSGSKQLAAGPVAITDDRGAYRVANLGPGQYIVSVPSVTATVPAAVDRLITTATPFATFDADSLSRLAFTKYPIPPPPQGDRRFAYPPTYAPSATSPTQATPVTLATGEAHTGVDVRIEPSTAATVSGRVDGPPDALNTLVLRLLPAGLESLGNGSETATSLVGANGEFIFLNVPAGTYTVEVRRGLTELIYNPGQGNPRLPVPPALGGSGWSSNGVDSAPPGVQWSSMSGAGTSAYMGRASVTVAGVAVAGIVVPLRHGSQLSGHVTREQKNPKPLAQNPFFGARFEPANGSPSLGIARPGQRPEDPDDFVLDNVAPGAYVLRFSQSAGWILKSITLDGVDYTYRPFDTSDGRDITNVRVVFTDQPTTLAGTVRVSTGSAADSAVIAFPVEQEQWSKYGFSPVRIKATRPAGSGAFQLTSLPEGEYFVAAVPGADADAWQDPEYLKQLARSAARVSLKWGQTSSVELTVIR